VKPGVLESMSLDDHRHGFATAMATLLAEFNAYLDRDHADPVADLVGYRQHAAWLSRDERLWVARNDRYPVRGRLRRIRPRFHVVRNNRRPVATWPWT